MAIVSEYEDPDWLVINTCGFIRDAKEESIEEILAALEKKEKGGVRKLAVFGCLIQRYHRDLKATFARRRHPLGGQRHRGAGRRHCRRPSRPCIPTRTFFSIPTRTRGRPSPPPIPPSSSSPRAATWRAASAPSRRSAGRSARGRSRPSLREAAALEGEGRGGIEPHLAELHLFRQGPRAEVASCRPC